MVGPITRKALERPRVPRPRSTKAGFHVEADLTLQVVYMVSDGKIVEILDASSASGQTYTVDGDVRLAVTPQGSFVIQRKIDAWRRSKLGLLYRPAYFIGRLRPPRRASRSRRSRPATAASASPPPPWTAGSPAAGRHPDAGLPELTGTNPGRPV